PIGIGRKARYAAAVVLIRAAAERLGPYALAASEAVAGRHAAIAVLAGLDDASRVGQRVLYGGGLAVVQGGGRLADGVGYLLLRAQLSQRVDYGLHVGIAGALGDDRIERLRCANRAGIADGADDLRGLLGLRDLEINMPVFA